jgi:hypothetical protein
VIVAFAQPKEKEPLTTIRLKTHPKSIITQAYQNMMCESIKIAQSTEFKRARVHAPSPEPAPPSPMFLPDPIRSPIKNQNQQTNIKLQRQQQQP